MKKNKVEILTFHWTINFGGLLQAYGLQQTLKKLGYEPSFINYHNKSELGSVSNWKRRVLQIVWDKIARIFFGREKREKITEVFRNQYLDVQSRQFTSYNELTEVYSETTEHAHAYVVGSDQVWNPNLTGGVDAYLLSYLPKSSKRIAYAASFGKASIPESNRKQFSAELPTFTAVSVREEAGADLVKELSGVDAFVAMDPAFLLDKGEWKKITAERVVEGNYVLCYYMNTGDKAIHHGIAALANELAQKHGCKVVNIGRKEYERLKFWENNLFDIGPSEFLSLIANAKFVVANSFHATAFANIFQVPYFVPVNYEEAENMRMSIRMENLVKKFGCPERLIACPINETNAEEKVKGLTQMDFSKVDEAIRQYRGDSIAFLSDALL